MPSQSGPRAASARSMAEDDEVHRLEELLEAINRAGGDQDEVSVANVHETVGVRSFGPLLLAAGVIGLTPIAGIPGLPTALAIIVILIAGQLLIGLKSFWLPEFVRRRSVSKDRLHKAIRFVRPVARGVDKLLRPRLSWLTEKPFTYAIAAFCILEAIMMPPLELVPFAGAIPAGAVTLFGLGLIARDGVLVVLAFGLSAASFYVAATSL
jgi:hypothetical protein